MRITFQRGETPSVFVTDPELSALAGERPLPHVYHDPLRLCLTLPGTREWTGTMRIEKVAGADAYSIVDEDGSQWGAVGPCD